MSYSIYKNNKLLNELSNDGYRLLQMNSKLKNPFHTYLMYSLVPEDLNNINNKYLNDVVHIFKSKINKYVKMNLNKSSINAKSNSELTIFSDLCKFNIYIFKETLNNLYLSTNNKNYKKGIFLLIRGNEYSLLVKKGKNKLILKFNCSLYNNLIQEGGVKYREGIFSRGSIPSERRDILEKEKKKLRKEYINNRRSKINIPVPSRVSSKQIINLSGELFDLTVTSYNNNFGKEKIDYSLKYGIELPIDKYIKELEMIADGSNDDKTEKRKQRLEFLKKIKEFPNLSQLFTKIIRFINGGEKNNSFEENNLIMVVAGGNIITIFVKLMGFIVNNYNIKKEENTKTILRTLYDNDSDSDIDMIYGGIRDSINKFLEDDSKIFVELHKKDFSDFDYNLLPNKLNNNNNIVNTQNSLRANNEEAGFFLLRAKTSIKNCKYVDMLNKDDKNKCKGTLDDKEMKLLFPQGVQQSFLKKAIEEKNSICEQYIRNLIERKNSIEDETKNNVKMVIDTFKKGIKYNKYKYANKKNPFNYNYIFSSEYILPFLPKPFDIDVISVMKYLNRITNTINKYIKNVDEILIYNKFDIKDFSSLESIVKSEYIRNISVKIIDIFLNMPDFFTETILDKIIEKKKRVNINCEMVPCKIIVVPNNYYKDLTEYRNELKNIYETFLGFPDGVNITINSIKTDPIIFIDEDIKNDISEYESQDDPNHQIII
tara:strand:- start:251 stop:2386 length:2136 start_codon:yes stop_codon:yes gene_type:complete